MLLVSKRLLSKRNVAIFVVVALVQVSFLSFMIKFSFTNNNDVQISESFVLPQQIYLARRRAFKAVFDEGNNVTRRNFVDEPINVGSVSGMKEPLNMLECAVPCIHWPSNFPSTRRPDASFSLDEAKRKQALRVLRSMESAANYDLNRLDVARAKFDVVMTTQLDSDVPVPYFSWVLHEFMKPPRKKTAEALSSAFISNCGAKSFRIEAIHALERFNIEELGITLPTSSSGSSSLSPGQILRMVDFFGTCSPQHTHNNIDKQQAIGTYKFHLAFENSMEPDYVTEKFLEPLIESSVPVVIGAPNIHDFEPSENSILAIETLDDVPLVAARMVELAANETAYKQMLAWKQTGPSDKFKALVDLAIVHSSCRLCIHVADRIRKREREQNGCWAPPFPADDAAVMLRHFFIRERGKFDYLDGFIRVADFGSLNALMAAASDAFVFSSRPTFVYLPSWTAHRDKFGRRPPADPAAHYSEHPPELRLYRIYQSGANQRDALYGSAAIDSNEKVAQLFKQAHSNCIFLEAILV